MLDLDLSFSGMKAVRWYSDTNQWIDFIVVVPDEYLPFTAKAVGKAMDAYWNDDSIECYGDAVEDNLRQSNIPYLIFFHDSEREDDEYEERWEAFVERCENPADTDPLAKKPSITFDSGEDMYDEILYHDYDLYSEAAELYVFPYNDKGDIAYYHIAKDKAVRLEKESEAADEYWGAFLGVGGYICNEQEALDFCNRHYQDGWIIVNC